MPQRSSRYQRMFARWFQKNKQRFLIPIELRKVNAHRVKIVLPAHPDCLEVCLWDNNLSVWVNWKDECNERILDLDVFAMKTYKGYQCRLCIKPRDTWPTLDALYEADLFEPFLSWVNNTLRHACAVHVYGALKSATWAELIDPTDTSPELDHLLASVPFTDAQPWLPVPLADSAPVSLHGRDKARHTQSFISCLQPLPPNTN